MRYLLRLLPYTKPYTGRVVATWLSVFASGAFVMVSPILVREAINQGLKPVRGSNHLVIGFDGNERLLIFAALAIIAFAVARGLTAFGQTYLGETVGQHVAYDIRNEIYNNIQRMSYAYHDQVETGQIMSRATQDVENIRMFFGMSLFRLGYVVVLVVVSIVGMFIVNPLHGGGIARLFSSHPGTADRVRRLREMGGMAPATKGPWG